MSSFGILFVAFIIFVSHIPPLQYLFVATIALLQAKALQEYYQLAKHKGLQPLVISPVLSSILYIVAHYFFGVDQIVVPFLFLFMALAILRLFSKQENAIANAAVTVFGIVYVTIPLSFLIDINFVHGSIWLVYLLITTKIADMAAYFAGKLLGSHPLAPTLSPKKTIEGAVAGLLGSIIASICFTSVVDLSFEEAFILGALIGVISQVGDLAESLFKRDAQVKDSSTLPGFGGMLDLVDSLIFTTPILYFWLHA